MAVTIVDNENRRSASRAGGQRSIVDRDIQCNFAHDLDFVRARKGGQSSVLVAPGEPAIVVLDRYREATAPPNDETFGARNRQSAFDTVPKPAWAMRSTRGSTRWGVVAALRSRRIRAGGEVDGPRRGAPATAMWGSSAHYRL